VNFSVPLFLILSHLIGLFLLDKRCNLTKSAPHAKDQNDQWGMTDSALHQTFLQATNAIFMLSFCFTAMLKKKNTKKK
jgi:hypothetical protein